MSVSRLSENKWFEQIMTRETPFLVALWKPLQYLQMKYVIVCGRIKKRQTNKCQKQVANYCPVKDDLYLTYTSLIISSNKLDKALERRY